MTKLTSRDANIRLYDGTGTPYYLALELDQEDFTGPLGQPLTEEQLVLNRGTMDSVAHYIEGPDDALMAAADVSFSVLARTDTQTKNLLDWLAAMNDGLSTTVNSNTLISDQGDTQRDGSNTNPTFDDSNKGTCIVEYKMERGGTDLLLKYNEVWFPLAEQSLSEGPDGIVINLTGHVYGTIGITATSFTSGTDVEA